MAESPVPIGPLHIWSLHITVLCLVNKKIIADDMCTMIWVGKTSSIGQTSAVQSAWLSSSWRFAQSDTILSFLAEALIAHRIYLSQIDIMVATRSVHPDTFLSAQVQNDSDMICG